MPPKSPETDKANKADGIRLDVTGIESLSDFFDGSNYGQEFIFQGFYEKPFMETNVKLRIDPSEEFFDLDCELHIFIDRIDDNAILINETIKETVEILKRSKQVRIGEGYANIVTEKGSRLALCYTPSRPESIVVTTGLDANKTTGERLFSPPISTPENLEMVFEDSLEILQTLVNVAAEKHIGHAPEASAVELRLTKPNDKDQLSALGNIALTKEMEELRGKFEIEISNVSFDDIGGNESAKQELELLVLQLKNPDLCRKWALQPQKGVVLYGPPGTGKTLMAKALAAQSGARFLVVNSSHINSKWFGESEKNVENLFGYANLAGGKTIIYLDELDSIAPRRSSGMHEATRKVLNLLLQKIDGITDLDNVTIVAATNRIEDVDEAFIRAGRLGTKIEVKMPDSEAIKTIYRIHISRAEKNSTVNNGIFTELDYESISQASQGFSGADVAEIIRKVLSDKFLQNVRGNEPGRVTTEDIIAQIKIYTGMQTRKKPSMGYL